MRKIKFKAKSKLTNKMVEGDLVHKGFDTYIHFGGAYIPVYPETVCEFTGIVNYDKQEVFENDIVRTTLVHDGVVGKVSFERGEFYIFARDYGILPITTSVTVIGNVYSNHEITW